MTHGANMTTLVLGIKELGGLAHCAGDTDT